MNYVLRPLSKAELELLFNNDAKKVIEFFIKKSIFSQPERAVWESIKKIQIPKEHIEDWVVQALWVSWVWAGSYAVDVINEKEHRWADIKMLATKTDDFWNITNAESWEASLAQKFKWTWANLDQLFEEWKYDEIKDGRIGIYDKKMQNVIKDKNLEHVYYIILLRWDKSLYIVWMESYEENLQYVSVDIERTSWGKHKKSVESVFLSWFIDDKLWSTKIYKAKKRLELRIKPKARIDRWLFLEFPINKYLSNTEINLLEVLKAEHNLDDYWIREATKLFKWE